MNQGQDLNNRKTQDRKHGTLYKKKDKYPSTVINAKAAITTVLNNKIKLITSSLFPTLIPDKWDLNRFFSTYPSTLKATLHSMLTQS
jgi:hypothetical protein